MFLTTDPPSDSPLTWFPPSCSHLPLRILASMAHGASPLTYQSSHRRSTVFYTLSFASGPLVTPACTIWSSWLGLPLWIAPPHCLASFMDLSHPSFGPHTCLSSLDGHAACPSITKYLKAGHEASAWPLGPLFRTFGRFRPLPVSFPLFLFADVLFFHPFRSVISGPSVLFVYCSLLCLSLQYSS